MKDFKDVSTETLKAMLDELKAARSKYPVVLVWDPDSEPSKLTELIIRIAVELYNR